MTSVVENKGLLKTPTLCQLMNGYGDKHIG